MKNRIILSILLCSSHAMAATSRPIGLVIFVANKVIVEQNYHQRTATRGMPLHSGDSIITNTGGEAIIKYNNGSLVTIHSNSNYLTSPATPQQSSAVNATLNRGTIDYASTGKKSQGQFHTPIISLAILGTQFTMSYSPSTKVTQVSVTAGEVKLGDQLIIAGQTGMTSSTGAVTIYSTFSSAAIYDENNTNTSTAITANVSAAQTANLSTSTNMTINTGVSVHAHFVPPK